MPAGSIEPFAVQQAASMKDYRPHGATKPDKIFKHMANLTERKLPEAREYRNKKESLRKRLRLLLVYFYNNKSLSSLIKTFLKYLDRIIGDNPAIIFGATKGFSVSDGGFLASLVKFGRAPPAPKMKKPS